MYKVNSIKWKPLIISILISLAVGVISGLLTRGSMNTYKELVQPPLSPPGVVFPIVWSVLYLLMGISAYLIYTSHSKYKKQALIIYAVQLAVNFLWTIIFFNLNAYLFAFIWLLLLWFLIVAMIIIFEKISKTAAYLQIPYLIWVTFAGYLNLAIYLLNK